VVHDGQRRGPRLRQEAQRRLPVLRDGGVRTSNAAEVDAARAKRNQRRVILALTLFALAAGGWLAASQLLHSDVEERQAMINLDIAANRVELYRLENGRYPAKLADLLGRYAKEAELKDMWGNPYVYAVPGAQGRAFDLTTLGADGKPGGEGRDRDRTWKAR
jgi:type II secretory pathway pseudopilin PulG